MNPAHVHLMLNHIPVLGAIASLALLVLADVKKDQSLSKLALQLMVLVALLTVPVYLSGEPAEEIVENLPGVSEPLVESHEDLAKFAFGSTIALGALAAWGVVAIRRNPAPVRKLWRVFEVAALANVVLMLIVANLGGQIRHTEIRKDATLTQPGGEAASGETEDDD